MCTSNKWRLICLKNIENNYCHFEYGMWNMFALFHLYCLYINMVADVTVPNNNSNSFMMMERLQFYSLLPLRLIILFVVLHICIFCWQLYILRSNFQWLNIYHQSDFRWIGVSLNISVFEIRRGHGFKVQTTGRGNNW